MSAILNSRLWLPISIVNEKKLCENFESKVYVEKACEKCDYLPDRFCSICAECSAYKGEIKLWKKNGSLIGVPIGDRKALRRITNRPFSIKDLRTRKKMRSAIQLTANLYDYQTTAIDAMARIGYGILQSPPRSGKTLMAVSLSLRLGYRVLIVAAQYDWLEQFLDEWHKFTNIQDVEKWEGRKLVGICKHPDEMRDLDIVLCTYQSFISKTGVKRLDAIKDQFGTLIVDEVHDGAALKYAQTLVEINARHRFGLSATPARKDGQECTVYKIIGPVKHKVILETMKPRLYLHETGAMTSYKYSSWVFAMRFLYNNIERNKVILKQLAADIKAKRHIVVPVDSVAHAKLLVTSLNKHFGKTVAEQFTANVLNKATRKSLLERARAGKIPCIVGTKKIIQVGLNVPIWDMQYIIAPISNAPKFEQQTSRIKSKMPGKPQPIVRHFIEDFPFSLGAFRTCLFKTYLPQRFEMDRDTKARAFAYAKNKPLTGANFGIV